MAWCICTEDRKDLQKVCSGNFIIGRNSLLASLYFFSNNLLNTQSVLGLYVRCPFKKSIKANKALQRTVFTLSQIFCRGNFIFILFSSFEDLNDCKADFNKYRFRRIKVTDRVIHQYAAELGIKPRSVFCKTLIFPLCWLLLFGGQGCCYLFSDIGIGCLLKVDLPQHPNA